MLFDPSGHALLDNSGRWLNGLVLPSQPTAAVVMGFVQAYSPNSAISSLSRTTGPDSYSHTDGPDSCSHTSGQDSCSHTARPESCAHTPIQDSCSHTAGKDSSSANATGPASKLGTAQARAAYSSLLEDFPAMVCTIKRLPLVSHGVAHHIITYWPPIAFKFQKLDSEKLAAAKRSSSSWKRTTLFRVPLLIGQPTSHGKIGGLQLASLRRLLPAQPGNRARRLPAAQHAGL
jgi:hypothetical protein